MKPLSWKIGEVEVFQIVEMEGGELIQGTIKKATPEHIKKISWLYPNFADENGKFKSLVQSFLVKSNGKNILVDTCNGNGKQRPNAPTWGNLNTNYLERLKSLGVSEDQIDIVICTHLHFDHVGWNTRREGNSFSPVFKKAKYLFANKEYQYWVKNPEKEMVDDKMAFADSVEPIVKAGLEKIVADDYRIDENLKFIPTPGHTPGHVSITIQSKNQKALISGDFLHHPCQVQNPDWTMDADSLPDLATQTRFNMIKKLANSDILLIGSHFSNPVAGYIVSSAGSYVFKT